MTTTSPTAVAPVTASAAATAAATAVLATPTPTGAVLYPGTTIISTIPETGPDATGNYVDGRTVTYQLPTGDIGSIWVPQATLTAEAVAAAINADAVVVASLYALNSSSV